MSTKLFVGNLSFNTTENDLQDLFAAYGPVQQVDMIMDRMTGRPRGFGFVTMENQADAQKAIEALHGKPFGGRDLTVNEARPREDRPGGGAGGRSYGGGGGGGGGGGYGGGGGGGGRDRGDRGGDRGERRGRDRY
jgi:RNA recognition motif-containing protein